MNHKIGSAVHRLFKAENRSGKEISVYLKDAYMNDTMFTACSGVPLDLLPEKMRHIPFSGNTKVQGSNLPTK
jgi:hypothetical protein